MALTATQLADLQADLGIDDSENVFTDEELDRLYARAEQDYATAVYYAWRQLLAASTKYIEYRVAQTSEKRQQVFSHIKQMVEYWQGESQKSTNAGGVKVAGITPVPPRWKDYPYTHEPSGRRVRRTRSY